MLRNKKKIRNPNHYPTDKKEIGRQGMINEMFAFYVNNGHLEKDEYYLFGKFQKGRTKEELLSLANDTEALNAKLQEAENSMY